MCPVAMKAYGAVLAEKYSQWAEGGNYSLHLSGHKVESAIPRSVFSSQPPPPPSIRETLQRLFLGLGP